MEQAECGVKTDNRIVELISADAALRPKLRDLLEESDSERVMLAHCSSLAGEVSLAARTYHLPAGNVFSPEARKFICPVPGHDYVRRIQKAGEDPGVCPEHHLPLIPFGEKKEGR